MPDDRPKPDLSKLHESPADIPPTDELAKKEAKSLRRKPQEVRRDVLQSDRIELENKKLDYQNQRLALENRRLELENRELDLKNSQRQWDNWIRVAMVGVLSGLVAWWLSSVLIILDRRTRDPDKLTDGVLIALLGTTTLNVVGLMYTIARYLFPQHKDQVAEK
jgi:hypothetical protein